MLHITIVNQHESLTIKLIKLAVAHLSKDELSFLIKSQTYGARRHPWPLPAAHGALPANRPSDCYLCMHSRTVL